MPSVFFIFIYYILATSTDYFQRVAVNNPIARLAQPVLAVPLANTRLAAFAYLITRGKAVSVWFVAAAAHPPVACLLNDVFTSKGWVGKEHVCPVKIIFHSSPPNTLLPLSLGRQFRLRELCQTGEARS